MCFVWKHPCVSLTAQAPSALNAMTFNRQQKLTEGQEVLLQSNATNCDYLLPFSCCRGSGFQGCYFLTGCPG